MPTTRETVLAALHARLQPLAALTLRDEVLPERIPAAGLIILRDGQPVGYLASGGYGYSLGQSIGYGYVRNAAGITDSFLMAGQYEIVVANTAFAAQIGLTAFYDPSQSRVKA